MVKTNTFSKFDIHKSLDLGFRLESFWRFLNTSISKMVSKCEKWFTVQN